MRLIDYYNIAAAVLMAAAVAFALWVSWRSAGKEVVSDRSPRLEGRPYWIAVALVLALGAFLRLWNLEGLPYGMQQDEASIGYEAYSLATYGIDRNGYSWPVYPITWGSGGGSPIMIYLNVITASLFGSSVWSVRIVPAFLGTLTLVLFFALLYRGFGRRTALAGLLILSLMPWHIILSRWSLDSNTTPFWQLLAAFVFVLAVAGSGRGERAQTGRFGSTGLLCLSAFLYGVCMYSYGSANVVVPLTLLFLSVWGLRHRMLTWKQLAGCFLVFAAVCVPLIIFYAINFLGLPEIATDRISFPKFTSSHFSSVFISFDSTFPATLAANLKGLLQTLTVGSSTEVAWNTMPEYWTLYKFTWPLLFAGMAWSVCRWWSDGRQRNVPVSNGAKSERNGSGGLPSGGTKARDDALSGNSAGDSDGSRREALSVVNAVMIAQLLAALLFTLFINASVNREVMLFLPLVYCLVMGLRWMYRAGSSVSEKITVKGAGGNIAAALALLLILGGAVSFCKDYYGGEYNVYAAEVFMPGYGEAMVYADEIAMQMDAEAGPDEDAATVYSTYNLVSSPYMLTLFYTHYNTYEFLDSVVYRDEEAEFRVATSFGHFVYGLPVEDTSDLSALMEETYWGDVFVLTRVEAEQFDEEDYEITWFGDRFAVVVRRQE